MICQTTTVIRTLQQHFCPRSDCLRSFTSVCDLKKQKKNNGKTVARDKRHQRWCRAAERRSGATAGSSPALKSSEQNPMNELKIYTRFSNEHISSFSFYNCLDLPVVSAPLLVHLCVFLMIKYKIRILIAHRQEFSCSSVFNQEP